MQTDPTISPDPGGGGGEPSRYDTPHQADCSTSDGAATSVANGIKATDDVMGPTDYTWRNVEYGAVIVQNIDGSFGPYEDKIVSNHMAGWIKISTPDDLNVHVLGIVHNHPNEFGGPSEDITQRYPSSADWDVLDLLFSKHSSSRPAYNPASWIIDPVGVVRKFVRSERAYFDSLSPTNTADGVGLGGKEVDAPCQQTP